MFSLSIIKSLKHRNDLETIQIPSQYKNTYKERRPTLIKWDFLSKKNKHGRFYLENYKVLVHKLEACMEMADYLAQVQIDILKTNQPEDIYQTKS